MGLLDTQIPADKRTPVDDNSFNTIFQSLYQNYQNQDPLDRQSTWAAQRQQDAYLQNKTEWDKILQSGGDLPSTSKPISFDPAESEKINQSWDAQWNKQVSLDGKDEQGNPFTYNATFRPLKTYGADNQFQMTPDYYKQIKDAYENYGPDVLKFMFS